MGHIKDNSAPSEIMKWFSTNPTFTGEILARAWLEGYEIESEKFYTVQIPNPNSYCSYTFLSRNDNGVCIDSNNHISWKWKRKNHFTEAEIKKDFEWAFQFAEPVEVE